MKNKVLLSLILLVGIFCFTGCTINKNINNKKEIKSFINKKVDLPGTYNLVELQEGKKIYGKNDLKNLKKHGMEVVLELRKDKTGTINIFDKKKDFKYDNNNVFINKDKFSLIYSNDKLIFKKDNSSLKFKKIK